MLDNKDPIYRTQAATSLGQIGPGAKEAVPALIKALKDKYYTVRQFAAQALGEIGPEAEAAIPQLTAALKDPAEEVSDAAEDALEKIKGKEKK
jgi:HEAT repeat protein